MKILNNIKDIPAPQVFNINENQDLDPQFFNMGQTKVYKKGAQIIKYDTSVKNIYYLHEGIIFGYRPDTEILNLAFICTHGFFGEGWYFSKRKSKDEIIAKSDCKITKFDENNINVLLSNINFVFNILHTISIKSISQTSRAQNMGNKSLKERLRQFIEALRSSNPGEVSLNINLSQRELAQLLNAHPVSISRALTELKKEINIQTFKNKIIIG